MTKDDREFLKEFSRGFAFCVAVVGGLLMFVGIFGTFEKEPVENFTVVDKYKGCEVVRYTDHSNRWHYLLDCRNG